MAANSQRRALVSTGRRFLNQIPALSSLHPSPSPSLPLRRAVHVSVYDKNPEENVRVTVVPDHVIGPQPDKYWAPHPQTGVFGPATEHNPAGGAEPGSRSSPSVSVTAGQESSVLEQKAFFRSVENLEKPAYDLTFPQP
ncbi:late embryogenesis abundant protein At5g17165-like [Diospyros lotus]|uniref:late embryogenesis abundant protein At5g17165-like n=1 Tax=Diospyros lotus TaxID=55363 RepID=UPI00224CCC0B|nr:late embryogenesis abundant protein At5g17165-like [Diospyros lotus]